MCFSCRGEGQGFVRIILNIQFEFDLQTKNITNIQKLSPLKLKVKEKPLDKTRKYLSKVSMRLEGTWGFSVPKRKRAEQ